MKGLLYLGLTLLCVLATVTNARPTGTPNDAPQGRVNPFGNATQEERRKLVNDIFQSLHREMPSRLEATLHNNTNYINRLPFPHMVQEGVFPLDLLRALANEIPENPESADGCIKGSPRCDKDDLQNNKNQWEKAEGRGPTLAAFFKYFKSKPWISFLEQLTGIKGIITDHRNAGGGIHQVLPGGFLKIHADFNRLYGYHRRVNVLLYLNEDWKEDFGGHLELWSKDMKSCMVRALPSIGQLAVFSSTDFSYHGHPEPLPAPNHRSRRSIALYYYSHTRPSSECLKGDCNAAHSTLFQETPCNCMDPKCQNFIVQR